MAIKKKPSKKKRRKPSASAKRKSLKWELMKACVGLTVLALIIVLCGFLIRHYSVRKQPDRVVSQPVSAKKAPVATKKATALKPSVTKKQKMSPPTFEVYPQKDIPHNRPTVEPRPLLPKNLPKVSIIIDDLGYDSAIADKFIGLDVQLTFSILPFSPFQKKIADEAKKRGIDVLLHLPMEPMEFPKVNPGPGALLTTMSPDELIRQLNADLDTLPFVAGVNNHMGSKMTAESDRMNQVFSVLKHRKLFFIDSRTTAKTQSGQSARLFKVPYAQRDVFLDHVPKTEYIHSQVAKLIRYAETHGEAIGIGHPHAVTYEVLRELLPELKSKVELVSASRVVRAED